MTRLPKLKISWRRGKQYTSPITLGGGGRHNNSGIGFMHGYRPRGGICADKQVLQFQLTCQSRCRNGAPASGLFRAAVASPP